MTNVAWGGKHSRMTAKQKDRFFRFTNRSLPPKENPLGVPRDVMKELAWEQLPFDKDAYNARLQELLAAYKDGA